jgi:hypothetical protein
LVLSVGQSSNPANFFALRAGFSSIAHGQRDVPLWEMAYLNNPEQKPEKNWVEDETLQK